MAVGNETINYRITAQDQASQVFRNLQGNMSKIASFGSTLNGVLGKLGIALGAVQVGAMFKQVVDQADALNDMSQKTGVAIETLSQFSTAAEKSGTSLGAVGKAIKTLSTGMVQASAGNKDSTKIFQALGIEVTNVDGSLRGASDVMMDVADVFQNLEDGALKSAIATKLFGKAGVEMIPMLNEGRQSISDMQVVMDTKFAQAADKFNDRLVDMNNLLKGGFVAIGPLVFKFFDDLAAAFSKIDTSGAAATFLFKAFQDILTMTVAVAVKAIGIFNALSTSMAGLAAAAGQVSAGDFSGAMTTLGEATSKVNQQFNDTNNQIFDMLSQLNAVKAFTSGGIETGITGRITPNLGDNEARTEAYKKLGGAIRETTIDQNEFNDVFAGGGGVNKFKQFLIDQQAAIDLLALEGQQVNMTASEYKMLTEEKKFDAEVAKLLEEQSGANATAFLAEAEAIKKQKMELISANEYYKQSIEGGFMDGLQKIREKTMNVGGQISDAMTNAFSGMEDALVSFVMTGKADFKSLANSIISDLIRIQIRSMLGGMFGGGGFNLGSLLGIGGGGQYSFGAGGYTGMGPFMAKGGPVSANSPYIVGEKGPELFMPGSSGSIVPNNALGGNSGGGVTINQTINVSTGVQQTVRAEIQQLLPQISNAAKNAILDTKRRGGQFANAFGG